VELGKSSNTQSFFKVSEPIFAIFLGRAIFRLPCGQSLLDALVELIQAGTIGLRHAEVWYKVYCLRVL
jgi:hypothetical protein